MKYTTKSGKGLPPEVVEVIEQLKEEHKSDIHVWGFIWIGIPIHLNRALDLIYSHDDYTLFNALYPKKDLDSYGNEIVKGEMCLFSDYESNLTNDRKPQEFICIGEKSKEKYIAYTDDYTNAASYKFCRKINSNETKKSELQSQMNELLKQAKEIEAKINEL